MIETLNDKINYRSLVRRLNYKNSIKLFFSYPDLRAIITLFLCIDKRRKVPHEQNPGAYTTVGAKNLASLLQPGTARNYLGYTDTEKSL